MPLARYVPKSPSQPLVDEPDTQDLDEMHYVQRDSSANAHAARRGARNADLTGVGEGFAGNTSTTSTVEGMRLRRGRICPSPARLQPGAPARSAAQMETVREDADPGTNSGGSTRDEMGDRQEDPEVGAQLPPSPGDDEQIATTDRRDVRRRRDARTAARPSTGGGVGDETGNGHEDAEAGAQMGAQRQSPPSAGDGEARATTGPQDVGEGRGARTGARGFAWSTGSREDQWNRRLKLAEAVRDAKAYYCPHGRTEERWRDVVNKVKDNNSLLFFALKPNSPGSTSWDTLKKEWMKIFKEWKRRNDAGANTSGAAEMYTELDQICQQIESLRVDAEQQAKAGVRRSSFQAPRQEEINSMINGDLRGRARVVARDLGEQLQQARDSGELGDDGGETFTPAPRADNPGGSSARSGRGGGARDAARALEAAMAERANARAAAEADARAEAARARAEADERREAREQARTQAQAAQFTGLITAFVTSAENARREDRLARAEEARLRAEEAAADREARREDREAQNAFMLEAIRTLRGG